MQELSDKQQAFVEHYLICWNASEAARRAGYSPKTAYSQGQRLLKNVEVAEDIKRHLEGLKMSADEVVVRLTEQGRSTLDDFGDVDDKYGGFHLDLRKAKKARKLGIVKKLKPTKYGYEIELYDAQAALVHLGRAHSLFKDVQQHEGEQVFKVIKGIDTDEMLKQP